MKRFAPLLQSLLRPQAPASHQGASGCQVQALLDELEDPPPNGLLLNLATGFPSALLCVLAAGVLAGALAGREVGGTVPPAAAVPLAAAQRPVVVVAAATQAGMAGPADAALVGRHAQLQALELQALQGSVSNSATATGTVEVPLQAVPAPSR